MNQPPLWTGLALVGALNARVGGSLAREARGISIDTRTLRPGDLFIALKGDARDGHEFARAAFEKGANAAVIDEKHARELAGAGPLLIVNDVQAALERLGTHARARAGAYVAAITGSVGKTTTKDMARVVFSSFGPTHASDASYNNHWGVPLSLARMPASTRYAFFELGMNHAGEIAALVELVKPQVAVITRVAAAHLEHFASVEAIADAKAEIFHGLLDEGVAILNRDDDTFERLAAAARASRAQHIFSFGSHEGADARLLAYETKEGKGVAFAEIFGKPLGFRVGAAGLHVAQNALAVLLMAQLFDLDLEQAAQTLDDFTPTMGRGAREEFDLDGGKITLIDESYNANPASMRAALDVLATTPPGPRGRRVAALGDMLELGPRSGELHAGLAKDLERACVDLLFTAGVDMERLFQAAPQSMRGVHRASAAELVEPLLKELRADDVLMVKGSNGIKMSKIVEALRQHAESRRGHQAG